MSKFKLFLRLAGVQCRCPTLFPKLDISTPVSTVLYTAQYRGSRCRGSRRRGPDVGGPDVGGPDVRGPNFPHSSGSTAELSL